MKLLLFAASGLLCISLIFGGCSSGGGGGGAPATDLTTFAELLWSPTRLQTEMANDQNLVVLDCRKSIANPGPNPLIDYDGVTYQPGEIHTPYKIDHIKGSHYINFFIFGDPYYPTDDSAVIQTLGDLGITTSTKICLYDAAIANPQGKVFYHLERLGCTDVHILDGGYPAWKAAGGDVEVAKTAAPAPKTFVPAYDDGIYLELDDMKVIWDEVKSDVVAGRTSKYAMMDYREDPLYWGHKICPDASRTGWIQYTTLLNWKTYMDASGFMKTQLEVDALTRAAGGAPGKINILICNKGWRTGFAYFALRYAGWPRANLKHYVGGVRAWTHEDATDYPMISHACYRVGDNMPKAAGWVNSKRFAGASAQVGSKLYCVGGYEVTALKTTGMTEKVLVSNVNQSFDFTKAKGTEWENDLETLPTPLAFSVGAAVNGYVYVMGGLDDTGTITDLVYRWDSLNPAGWSAMATMPGPRFSYAGTVVGNDIYVFGGLTGKDGNVPSNYSDDFYVYHHDTNTWDTLNVPNTPHARRCHAMVTSGTDIYMVGGFYKEDQGGIIAGVDLRDIWVLDTTNIGAGWVQKADLPNDIAGHSAGIANGKIYTLGGWTMDGVKYDAYEFDIASNTSRQLYFKGNSAAIGWPRFWYFLGTYLNEVVSIGGYGGSPSYISTTDTSGFAHFHQPYVYNVLSSFDP